ncbi:hypothetical protein T8K17_09470 [Thalassobaculum sp. OXR-137]|uniref:hypothetical protein n=1 Tax=Thalassobaculum sp. OXR-137 TaxID=3100173 RepID=UPI002AC8D060|nr:hypothetical protein [Thalassobaculum sp. OXR-137]WPZ36365.1 hypothetical protein T8K17_09470 [Thalassobaculum sp. OXR-137]
MRLFLAALLLCPLVLQGISAAAAQDAGLDWQSVRSNDTKILIDLPEATGHGIFLKASDDSFSSTFHVARYKTDKFKLDRAMLVYIELQPGYHFRIARTAERVLKWRSLQGADIDLGQRLQLTTDRGLLDVQRFRFENNVECAAIAQTWGVSGGELSSAGTDQLLGYLCEAPDVAVTTDRLLAVAQAIHVRD